MAPPIAPYAGGMRGHPLRSDGHVKVLIGHGQEAHGLALFSQALRLPQPERSRSALPHQQVLRQTVAARQRPVLVSLLWASRPYQLRPHETGDHPLELLATDGGVRVVLVASTARGGSLNELLELPAQLQIVVHLPPPNGHVILETYEEIVVGQPLLHNLPVVFCEQEIVLPQFPSLIVLEH